MPGTAETFTYVRHHYDNRNRLVRTVFGGSGCTVDFCVGACTRFTYDGTGNILTMTTPSGTWVYTYDRFGRLLSSTDPMGFTETFTYDIAGRMESRVDRNGTTFRYYHDDMNRLTAQRNNRQPDAYLNFTYFATGLLQNESIGSALVTTTHYVYDELGRVIVVAQCAGTSIQYTYDLAGNRTSATLRAGGSTMPVEKNQTKGSSKSLGFFVLMLHSSIICFI